MSDTVKRGAPMIDHISLGTRDLGRAVAFYDAVLAPLGYARLITRANAAGYGPEGKRKPNFWMYVRGGTDPLPDLPGLHVAFWSGTRSAVDEFHRQALARGGRDNGAPGQRHHYHPNFYGAFVIDPDGHRVEAVCHADESAATPLPNRRSGLRP